MVNNRIFIAVDYFYVRRVYGVATIVAVGTGIVTVRTAFEI